MAYQIARKLDAVFHKGNLTRAAIIARLLRVAQEVKVDPAASTFRLAPTFAIRRASIVLTPSVTIRYGAKFAVGRMLGCGTATRNDNRGALMRVRQ